MEMVGLEVAFERWVTGTEQYTQKHVVEGRKVLGSTNLGSLLDATPYQLSNYVQFYLASLSLSFLSSMLLLIPNLQSSCE